MLNVYLCYKTKISVIGIKAAHLSSTLVSVILLSSKACLFYVAWDGRYCEEDANGCALLTCFEGVRCFDMAAPNVGAACGRCPTGYEGDGEKCSGKCVFVDLEHLLVCNC